MVFAGYNWFLIIVAVVVSLLAVAVAVYILITYQHPEDKNQAWLPKIVVVFGVSLSIWTVLLFPLDVGNQKACAANVALSTCTLAIPTKALWCDTCSLKPFTLTAPCFVVSCRKSPSLAGRGISVQCWSSANCRS